VLPLAGLYVISALGSSAIKTGALDVTVRGKECAIVRVAGLKHARKKTAMLRNYAISAQNFPASVSKTWISDIEQSMARTLLKTWRQSAGLE